jgi:predicted DNA-binding transcriptional regulator AlpA
MGDRLISPDETARLIGVSRSSYYRLRRAEPLLRPVRVGQRLVRHRLSDVVEFINTRPLVGTDKE